MKTRLAICLLVSVCTAPLAAQHVAFDLEPFLAPADAYETATLPAATFAGIIRGANQGITDKDACLGSAGTLTGYKADFDGDGTPELCLTYHLGADDAGCSLVVFLAPGADGSYTFVDMLRLPGGTAFVRPIHVLKNGVQLYLQNTYALPDGHLETKGTVFGLYQKSLIIYISWTEKTWASEGKSYAEAFRVAFSDINFDGTKELFLYHHTHETAGEMTDKNMIDAYVLTYDYVPSSLRYVRYDSTGYDKVQEAEKMARAAYGKLYRESTFTDGVIKMREALRLNPFLTSSRVRLGEMLLMSGRYGDAVHTLLEAQGFEPDYAKTYKLLGDTYLRLNDLQKALAAYNRYLELNPNAKDRKKVEHNIKQITIPKAR